MGTTVMMLGFCILSIVLILLISHNHADINLIMKKLDHDCLVKPQANLFYLLKKYEGKDVILTRKLYIDGDTVQVCWYSSAIGTPLQLLDSNQKAYTSSNCEYVYWNPYEHDLLANDWFVVREGKPLGTSDDLGEGLVVLKESDVDE